MSTCFINNKSTGDAIFKIIYDDVVDSARFTQLKGGGIELFDASDTLQATIYDSGSEFRWETSSTINYGANRGYYENLIVPVDLILGKNISKARLYAVAAGSNHTINKVEIEENRAQGSFPSGDIDLTLFSGTYQYWRTSIMDLGSVISKLDITVRFKFGVGQF